MIKSTLGLLTVFGIITSTDVHLDKTYESKSMVMAIPDIPEYKPLKIPNNYVSVREREDRRTIPAKKKVRTVRKLGPNRA